MLPADEASWPGYGVHRTTLSPAKSNRGMRSAADIGLRLLAEIRPETGENHARSAPVRALSQTGAAIR